MGKEWEARSPEDPVRRCVLNTLKDGLRRRQGEGGRGQHDEALAAYDEAVVKFNKEFDEKGGTADAPTLELYKELLAESDKLVERVETPEFESSVDRARHALREGARPSGARAPGAKLTPSGREIAIEGVDRSTRRRSSASSRCYPPRPRPGTTSSSTSSSRSSRARSRCTSATGRTRRATLVRFAPSEGYELNKPYRMTIHVKGSQISLKQADQPENRDRFKVDTSRTGGIGFGMKDGSKAIISVCKLKVLRPKG